MHTPWLPTCGRVGGIGLRPDVHGVDGRWIYCWYLAVDQAEGKLTFHTAILDQDYEIKRELSEGPWPTPPTSNDPDAFVDFLAGQFKTLVERGTVFAIGVGLEVEPEVFTSLAAKTRGEAFIIRKGGGQIQQAFETIGHQMEFQFLLSYYTQSRQYGWHRIQVSVPGWPHLYLRYPKQIFFK